MVEDADVVVVVIVLVVLVVSVPEVVVEVVDVPCGSTTTPRFETYSVTQCRCMSVYVAL